MKKFFNHFIWMFGGLCLITLLIEYPYSVYQGTEFNLAVRTMTIYLVISSLYAIFHLYSARKPSIKNRRDDSPNPRSA